MADLQLRSLERRAQQGDPQAAARQLLMRVRMGQLPIEHIEWAAQLKSPIARIIVESPNVLIGCGYCKARRERWEADKRVYKEPLPVCLKCRNTLKTRFDGDLIRFVKQVSDVPLSVLIAWVCDCAERSIEKIVPVRRQNGRYRLPNQPERDPMLQNVIAHTKEWLDGSEPNALLYQMASSGGPGAVIAKAVVQGNMEAYEHGVRMSLADLVSHCWDGTRVERTWQEDRLIHYLLSYCGAPT